MDIFLNELNRVYSNNATNLYHLTTHSTACCPTKWRPCGDHRAVMTLLQPMYTDTPSQEVRVMKKLLCLKRCRRRYNLALCEQT